MFDTWRLLLLLLLLSKMCLFMSDRGQQVARCLASQLSRNCLLRFLCTCDQTLVSTKTTRRKLSAKPVAANKDPERKHCRSPVLWK